MGETEKWWKGDGADNWWKKSTAVSLNVTMLQLSHGNASPARQSTANSSKAGLLYPDAAEILSHPLIRPSSLRHSPAEPTHEEAGAVAQEVSARICDD